MNDPAATLMPARGLRVFVAALDTPRRAQLRAMLRDAGHDGVDSPDAADVVLADGDYSGAGDRPIVALGAGDADHAGLLARNADVEQIDAALRAAAAGLIVRSPDYAAPGFRALRENNLQALLTPREIEILSAIGAGLTNKAIARRLNISLHTVKFHLESLFRKLDARTRGEAVAKAAERLRGGAVEL